MTTTATAATATTYIDINLDQNEQTANIKLSNPAFNTNIQVSSRWWPLGGIYSC
jgi:hypothetical protein